MQTLIIKNKNGEQFNVFYDDEDKAKVVKYSWSIRKQKSSSKYINYTVQTTIGKRWKPRRQTSLTLSNCIMGPVPEGFDVWDHIDRNTLDNRKCNLRPATNQQNCCNKKIVNEHNYKGVRKTRGSKKNPYTARIKYNKKEIYLGCFPNAIEAAKAYDEAALKYFGEFVVLNFPLENNKL